MSLTEHQIKLLEINKTLTDNSDNSRGKIGIFLPNKTGDAMTAMSILKYKNEFFPNKNIVWFCNLPTADVLKFAPISEVREYRYESLDVDPMTQLQTKDGKSRLDNVKKYKFDWSADLEDGFFPAPWALEPKDRDMIDYPNISKKIFGIPNSYEWHPYLSFSDEEREMVKDFCNKLPYKKTIMLETDSESGQTGWNDDFTKDTIRICREKLGNCNFIFASKKDCSTFIDDIGVVSASNFTVRQTALINNYSDLFVGVSSGISVATSCWGNKPTPKIQFCNSFICSTVSLANGPIELISPNDHQNTLNAEDKIKILRLDFQSRLHQIIDKL